MKIRRAKAWDLGYIADHLRSADEAEFKAVIGLGASREEMREVLMAGLGGAEAYTVIGPSGKPACAMGIFLTAELNVVWLVGTDECQQCRLFILRHAKRLVKEWYEKYGTLGNAMWVENYLHAEWVRVLGFQFTGREFQQGPLRFQRFIYRQQH